jgi:DNA repair ATPase RecN
MSDEAIERRLQELRETAKKYAAAYANMEYLEEFKKSKLAILMKKYEREGFTTAAAQDREARADKDYQELLAGLQAARELSESLRWELKIAEIGAEVWRTKEASKRAERKGYGA